MQFSGRIRGIPGPTGTYPFTVTATSLHFGSPVAGPARWFLDFDGRFDCEHTPAGTVVTHREEFWFKPRWRWIAPFLRRWLPNDVGAEMLRFRALIEQDRNR